MTRTSARRAVRIASLVLGACTLATSGAGWALNNYTTGGAEVRGFFTNSATQVYAAAYGGGLWNSTTTGTSFSRVALPGNVHYLTAIDGKAGTIMAIGAEEGLLVSASPYSTFTQVLFEPVQAVAVAPNGTTILAAIKGAGVVRSTTSGSAGSFAPVTNTGFDSLDVFVLTFDPSNSNIAYAAAAPDASGARGGIFKSADGGATWTNISGNLPNKQVQSIAVDSAGHVYVGLNNGRAGDVYAQTTAGTWQASGALFGGVVSLARDLNSPTNVYAGSASLGLQRGSCAFPPSAFSCAIGYQFPQANTADPLNSGVTAVATFPGSNNTLQALKGAGVWLTTGAPSSSRTWNRVAFAGADRVRALTGVSGSATTYYAGLHAGGVWKTTTGEAGAWSAPNFSLSDFSVGPQPNAAAVQPFMTIFDLSASATNANVVYAAASAIGMPRYNDYPGVFRFNGTQWLGINNAAVGGMSNIAVEAGMVLNQAGVVQPFAVTVDSTNDNQVLVGSLTGANGALRRITGGTWSGAGAGGPISRFVQGTGGNTATFMGLLWGDKPQRSTNSGVSFSTVSVSQMGFDFLRFFSAAQDPGNANLWVAGTNKGLFRSVDNGASWSRLATMNGVFTEQVITAVGYLSSGHAYAADFSGNRYCSFDSGATWAKLSGTLNAGVNAIEVANSKLYYLTDGAGFVQETQTATCP